MKKIKLTQGKYALVDDEDYEELNKYKWCANNKKCTYYALRNVYDKETKNTRTLFMHRIILNTKKGEIVDHIDGNGLNNQRNNIRICTYSENNINRRVPITNKSGFKGVYWNKKSRKWVVQIKKNGIRKFIGYFAEIEKAKDAYKKEATILHDLFIRSE